MPNLVRSGPVVALALVLVAAALLLSTFGAQYADLGGAFSPMFFPRIVLWACLGLGLLNLAGEAARRPAPRGARLGRVAAVATLSVGFLLLMPSLGFFLSAAAFGVATLLALDVRAPAALLVVGVGAPAALVALFNHVLTLPLPTSPFSWMF